MVRYVLIYIKGKEFSKVCKSEKLTLVIYAGKYIMSCKRQEMKLERENLGVNHQGPYNLF